LSTWKQVFVFAAFGVASAATAGSPDAEARAALSLAVAVQQVRTPAPVTPTTGTVVSQTCDCHRTGVCVCDPGLCRCEGCPTHRPATVTPSFSGPLTGHVTGAPAYASSPAWVTGPQPYPITTVPVTSFRFSTPTCVGGR
jgi:hypothetical protein